MGGFISNQDKLSFREIALGFLKKILDISTEEFKGGYMKRTYQGNSYQEEYVPDQRKCYIQAVENFAYVLVPHFDEPMKKVFEEYELSVDLIEKELINERTKRIKADFEFENKKRKVTGKELLKEIELEERLRNEKAGDYFHKKVIDTHLRYAQILFKELNLLLKRIDYLSGSIYSEGDEDDEEFD